ncbi:MAG: SRPBCC family protein [Rhizobiaceae bacterium]|nr:SRPBCC family protein [Rhizobiaceae bacterium]
MANTQAAAAAAKRDLVLELLLDAPREKLYRCWTEPQLLMQFFAPKPWTTAHAELDVRAGGTSYAVMRSPEGQEFPSRGVYLEVVPNAKIVFTDAFESAWVPSNKPFFVGTILFEDAGEGKTRYTAIASHWTDEDRDAHEKMGFHQGWGQVAGQLEALAKTI